MTNICSFVHNVHTTTPTCSKIFRSLCGLELVSQQTFTPTLLQTLMIKVTVKVEIKGAPPTTTMSEHCVPPLPHPRWFPSHPSYFSWCPTGDFLAQLLPGLLITDMVKVAVKVVGKVGAAGSNRALPVKSTPVYTCNFQYVSCPCMCAPNSEHLSEQLGYTRTIYFLLDLLLTFKPQLSHTLDKTISLEPHVQQ